MAQTSKLELRQPTLLPPEVIRRNFFNSDNLPLTLTLHRTIRFARPLLTHAALWKR
jgi:hypothetical protein